MTERREARGLQVVAAALAAVAGGCAPSAPPGAAPPASGLRVQASGPAAAALVAAGAAPVADYGAFQILEASPAALAALPAGVDVEVREAHRRIFLNAGEIDTSAPAMQARRVPTVPPGGAGLHLVHYAGPIRAEWLQRLRGSGVRVVSYVASNAYLVWGDAAGLDRLHALALSAPEIQWDGPYLDDYKLDPGANAVQTGAWAVQLVEDAAANADTLALVRGLETRPTLAARALGYVDLVVYADRAAVDLIVRRPDVVSIQPYPAPRLFDERQDAIVSGQLSGGVPSGPGYLAWLASKGFDQAQFDASGFGVDVSDSGIDNGTLLPNHFGLYRLGEVLGTSRVAYNRLEGTPNPGSTIQGCDGHGTINAHIVAGYSDLSGAPFADLQGFRYGLGVAPFVRLGGSVVFDGCGSCFTHPSYENLHSRAHADGMRISSNSWGSGSSSYGADSQRYDALVRDASPAGSAVPQAGNQEMVIVFAAGNSGPYSGSVGTPGTAKNVLTAGASENVQAFGGPDQCGASDLSADAAMDLASFSSRGPTADGRRKPDLVAPGTHVSGGVFQADGQRASPPAAAAGQAAACFNGSDVCGGTGPAPGGDFFPSGQQWYTASTGTSHSTPAIAGAAALLRQRHLNQGRSPPSPAMTKAYLMSAARYMTGAGAADSLYSNAQGMGLLDLGAAFDDTPRLLRDQDPVDLFTATGQTRTFTGVVADSTRPFRVTLAWTDAPGPTFGAAWVNDLDLAVTAGGVTYKGNVFSGPTSIAGGSADRSNNVESVFLPPGASGAYTVTVTAANVAADGVPNNGIPLDQDFALVISNTCDTQPAVPAGVTATASADNQVTVSWTPNGAPAYNVYRATAAGGPYTRLASVAVPPWVDVGVSGGTTYRYVVRAQDCAESGLSAEATVTATGTCLLQPTFGSLQSAAPVAGLTCAVSLGWSAATPSCGGTIAYDVHRSTAGGFTPSPANRIATGVTGTSYLDSGTLVGGTPYFYVVRAIETTPGGAVSDGNTVERSVAPGLLSFRDDLDGNRPPNAAAWWLTPLGAAQLNLVAGCRYQSPTTAWRFGAASTTCGGAYPANASSRLVLGGDGSAGSDVNGFAIAAAGATLTFRIWYSLESYFDGAYLVYSTTGAGGPFSWVPDTATAGKPYIVAGRYDGSISGAPVRGWTGTSAGANGALKQVTVDLEALAGQTAWFGWSFSSDSSINYEGFYLDEVALNSGGVCFTTPPGPGDPVRFQISGLPSSIAADAPATLTLTALDLAGSVAAGYAGTAALTSSDPTASLPQPVTFSGGVATATVRLRKAGGQTVTAVDLAVAALRGAASTVVVPGPDAALAFVTQPSTITAGTSFYPPVQVGVYDAFGNLASSSNATVTLAVATNPGGGRVLGGSVATAVSGIASFSASVDKAGTGYTLSASAPGPGSATSAAFNVNAGFPTALSFTQQPTDAIAGEALVPPVTVAPVDGYGNPSWYPATVTMSLQAGPPGATLSGTLTANPDPSGSEVFDDLRLAKAGGGYQLKASAWFAQGISAPFAVGHAAPYRVTLTRQPTDVQAGAPFAAPVSAALLDRFGNPAITATSSVSLSFASNPGGGQLLGHTAVAASGGAVSFPDVAIDRAGRGYALFVGASGLYGETSLGFDVTAGPAARLAFLTSPSSGPVGAPLAPPIAVAVADGWGNVVASAQAAITLSLSSNPSGAALLGTLTRDAVSGVATFPDLSVGGTGYGFVLRASTPGIQDASSAPFELWPGPAASYAWPAGANATAGIETQLTITARDALGNLATGYGGTASLASSDPAAQLPGTARFLAGEATVRVTFNTAGTQTITAADLASPSISGTASVSVTALSLAGGSGGCGCAGSGGLDEVGLAALALLGGGLRRRRRRSPAPTRPWAPAPRRWPAPPPPARPPAPRPSCAARSSRP